MSATGQPARARRVVIAERAQVTPTLVVRRALPTAGLPAVGPWVLLDHFGPLAVPHGDRGTEPHPHAGIETVTYLFAGSMHHRDSLGHEGRVGPGGAQWMTAGRGLVHAERPGGGEPLHGLQLWTKLPRAIQFAEPAYQNLLEGDLPVFRAGDADVRVVGGTLAGHASPAGTRSPLLLAHLAFAGAGRVELPVPAAFELALYVAAGEASVGEVRAAVGTLVCLSGGSAVGLSTSGPADVMLLGGARLEEPLVFHGPFVMDSAAAIRQAERAYVTGEMGTLAA